MKRKYRVIVLLASVFLLNITNAQTVSPGYIVTTEKDTIRGFIIDQTDAELGLGIEFKKELSNPKASYFSSGDLLGFGFNYGRLFERVSMEDDSNDSVKVFAKRIVQGKIDMLVWRRLKGDSPYIFLTNKPSRREVYMTRPREKSASKDSEVPNTLDKKKHIGLLIYVKSDSSNSLPDEEDFRYSKKSITKNIQAYNSSFDKDFPVSQYKDPKKFTYDITVGTPILWTPEGFNFRVAFYRNKTLPEKSRKISLTRGISYRHWTEGEEYEGDLKNVDDNYRQQLLTIIPIGVNVHGNSGRIRPYAYIGVGLTFLLMTNHHIVNYENTGDSYTFVPIPSVNIGAGAKIKVGSNFILCELTPAGAGGGLYLNLGYSF